jgi:protocatechuate 3,4-dioxygenase beta subunit
MGPVAGSGKPTAGSSMLSSLKTWSLASLTAMAPAQIATGHSQAGSAVSAKVISPVVKEVKMFVSKKMAILPLSFLMIAGLGITAVLSADADPPAKTASKDDVKIRGRVLDPDGKPFAGAKLYLGGQVSPKEPTYSVRATSGDDGRFEFTVANSEQKKPGPDAPPYQVLAVAKDHGCGWATVVPGAEELTLRLVKDAPVKGRILDPDGKPVAGARLTVTGVSASKGDADAGGWVGPLPGGTTALNTDKDGRFELNGVGSDRAVGLLLEGTGIATAQVNASGTKFEYQAVASRPVRGMVRDKDTGKPIPGATVSAGTAIGAVTDKEGRYELLGLAKGPEYGLMVTSAEGNLYFQRAVRVQDTPGLGPIAADVELVRGRVIVSGRVTDKATGKLVAGAKLEYYPLQGNDTANLMDRPSFPRTEATTARDGTYTLAVMPGPGVIGVTGPKRDLYMPAWVTAKELKDLFKIPPIAPGEEGEVLLAVAVGGQLFRALDPPNYHALVLLQPGEQDKALVRDVALEMPQERKGRVLGPDGKALPGVTVWGLSDRGWSGETLKGDEFTVRGMNPRAPRALAFHHKDKNVGLALKELPDEKSGPLTVTLQPCGSLSGRIVDRDSRPLPAFRLDITPNVALGHPTGATTDEKGHFRAEGLIPGMKYTLWLPRQRAIIGHCPPVESGKDKDLGDVMGER